MSCERMIWLLLWIRFECLNACVMIATIGMRLKNYLVSVCPFIFRAFFDQARGR